MGALIDNTKLAAVLMLEGKPARGESWRLVQGDRLNERPGFAVAIIIFTIVTLAYVFASLMHLL